MKWDSKNHKVMVPLSDGMLTLSFPEGGGVRLQYGAGEPETLWCPILEREPASLPLTVAERDGELYITDGKLTIVLTCDAGLRILHRDRVLWHTPSQAFRLEEGIATLSFHIRRGEQIFGLGQDPMARLNQNGRERRMWNQWGGHERSGNCGIGFFTSDAGYGMLLNSAAAARFCFGESQPSRLDPLGEAMVPSPFFPAQPLGADMARVEAHGALDLFVLLGNRPALLTRYHELTGMPGLLPKWSYGFLQCKNRYMNRENLMIIAKRFRESNIPCDGLIIDWLWFTEFGDLEWQEEDWPNACEMLDELARNGFRVSSAQHPFISEKGKYFEYYKEKGYLNKVPMEKRITYDHTHPEARAHWWEKTSRLYRQGLRGYWTDMGELEEHFDGTESYAGGRIKTHNAYSLLWSQGLHKGQREEYGTRAFILSRSGCAGIQKYSTALWSGDINATWQVLRDQVVIGQGVSMSGLPWWCSDIGGFLTGSEFTPELYIRWMEWGVFCSVFRTHGTRPGNEPWSFGEAAQKYIEELIGLRYRLLPYVYSLAMDCALNGTPLVRPMAWEYGDDLEATACQEQFLFGPSLLVAPVTEKGARIKRVYLPKGHWVHWWSKEVYEPGWHTVSAPLGQIPLFIKAGSVIPIFDAIGHNAESCGGLTLLTVPGDDGAFDFYDDSGDGFGYETGEYVHVRFHHKSGKISCEAINGLVPCYTLRPFEAQKHDEAYTVDCAWEQEKAVITLTFLDRGAYNARLEPESGWMVTRCTAGGVQAGDVYEQAWYPAWEGTVKGDLGDTVRWTLVHTACTMRVGTQQAQLYLTEQDGSEKTVKVSWDGPWLSAPHVLGCIDAGDSNPMETVYAPEKDPDKPYYEVNGKLFHWQHDDVFARNPFGYVDFRRLGAYRDGEAMKGVAYARENLYSKEPCQASLYLRHDSPIVIWLNGAKLYASMTRNVPEVVIDLTLEKGQNTLLIKQIANIERPYSGGEFGHAIQLEASSEVYVLK